MSEIIRSDQAPDLKFSWYEVQHGLATFVVNAASGDGAKLKLDLFLHENPEQPGASQQVTPWTIDARVLDAESSSYWNAVSGSHSPAARLTDIRQQVTVESNPIIDSLDIPGQLTFFNMDKWGRLAIEGSRDIPRIAFTEDTEASRAA